MLALLQQSSNHCRLKQFRMELRHVPPSRIFSCHIHGHGEDTSTTYFWRSFWSLQDILLMGESAHYFFWDHPQNYTLFSIIIPLLAVTSVLVYRRSRSLFFVGAILIVGVLATAGVNSPIGSVYYLLASRLPYGAGAILRNPTKFVPTVTFAYGLLLGLWVVAVNSLLSSRRFPPLISGKNLVRYAIVLAVVFLVLAPITYGTLLDLQEYTRP